MVEPLNCGPVKRATSGFVLTPMTGLVTGRMAEVPAQTAPHGALLTHLWHMPGMAEWAPMACMTMFDAWGSLCTLSNDSID
jgi:hypothetical protein